MTKRDFLEELRIRLSGYDEKDVAESVAFYEEMIDDRIEEGWSEEEAIKEIGTPADVAAAILKEMPLGKLLKARVKPKGRLPVWAIVLLCIGSPIWASLLVALLAVVISLYAALWSVVLSVWAVDLSLVASGFACVVFCPVYMVQGFVATGFAFLGVGVFAVGIFIFLFYGCLAATKGICLVSKKVFLLIKGVFVRKEAVQ